MKTGRRHSLHSLVSDETRTRVSRPCSNRADSSERLMSTQPQRGRARHDRNRRRFPIIDLRGRARPVALAKLGTRIVYVPLMCSLYNGRAADRISVGKR